MVEKAGCEWAGCVSASSKDGDDLVVGDLAGVWEAVYGMALLTSTRSRSFSQSREEPYSAMISWGT